MCPDAPYVILLCLMPDDFTCQGESAATQCVNRATIVPYNTWACVVYATKIHYYMLVLCTRILAYIAKFHFAFIWEPSWPAWDPPLTDPRSTVRPMKIDIMFLVPARMGFICRTKFFHYSLFLKNRLNKTPNWSPDQRLIATFYKRRNSNCIFLKISLARMPLFFMSALVCIEIYCSVAV
jgi:hypothetical protein